MPEQMGAEFEQVMAQCSRGCFTGLLRVRTREGNGEIRFLSGIQDGIRFDTVEGAAALERLLAASEPEFEAISSLPPISGSSEPLPTEGALERYHAAQLMRYCESNSLTCALELEVDGRVLTARYRLGELLSVEPDSEHTARLAEAKEGLYRFRLPRFELPANVQQRRSASVAPKPAAAAAAVPAAAPVAKPAPAKSAASLAETPLVAMKAVPVGAPPASTAKAPAQPSAPQSVARAPAAAPAAKGTSSPPRSVEPRPAAPAPRFESPSNPPPAVVTRRDEPRAPAARAAAPAAPAAAPAAARVAPSPAQSTPAARPAPSPAAARSEEPAAPRSPAPPSGGGQQKPLEGLWVDAVKPPPQSAPLELEHAPPSQAGGAQRGSARAEGLSSLAYKPGAEAPKAPQAAPRQQQRSSAIYWVVAILLLLAIAAAGWFFFGR